MLFGGLALFVLGLALLVVPALAAQSVNGDRERGTLATLQVTRLSSGEIVLGKFVAAWGTALVFLALTLPLVLYAMTQGGVPLGRVLVVLLVLALLLGTVCAVSLLLSAVLSRTTTSGVLAYLAVFALAVGTLIVFGLVTAVTAEQTTVTYENDCARPARRQRLRRGHRSRTRRRRPAPTAPGGCSPPTRSWCSPTPRRSCRWSAAEPPDVVRDASRPCRPATSTRSGRSAGRCATCAATPGSDDTVGGGPLVVEPPARSAPARSGRPAWRSTSCSGSAPSCSPSAGCARRPGPCRRASASPRAPSGSSSGTASSRTWATMLCSARSAAPAEPPQLLR